MGKQNYISFPEKPSFLALFLFLLQIFDQIRQQTTETRRAAKGKRTISREFRVF